MIPVQAGIVTNMEIQIQINTTYSAVWAVPNLPVDISFPPNLLRHPPATLMKSKANNTMVYVQCFRCLHAVAVLSARYPRRNMHWMPNPYAASQSVLQTHVSVSSPLAAFCLLLLLIWPPVCLTCASPLAALPLVVCSPGTQDPIGLGPAMRKPFT